MPPDTGGLLTSPMPYGRGVSLGDSYYKNERTRLDSYAGFQNAFIDVAKLASAGFYFTKRRDVVRCVFCKVEIGNWEQGDDPVAEHKKWSGCCPFVNGQEVGNMPANPRPTTEEESRGVDECGLYGITPVNPLANVGSLERLGITRTITAQHVAFSSLQERLKSFDTWPMALQPRPEALAAAGFFYTGQGDRCVCYQCGGGLKDWSESDDPWVEHGKYFPECTHVIRTKGHEFINTCRTAVPPNLASVSTPTSNLSIPAPAAIPTPPPPAVSSTTIESSSESSSTGSREEASCSRTEATTSPQERISEEKEDTEKPVGSASCTKEDTKDEKSEVLMCKICYQKEMSIAFLPCGHVVACAKCAPSLQHCAVCRENVTATVRVYLA